MLLDQCSGICDKLEVEMKVSLLWGPAASIGNDSVCSCSSTVEGHRTQDEQTEPQGLLHGICPQRGDDMLAIQEGSNQGS